MVDLPHEVLFGVAYGLVTGLVPALAVGLLAAGVHTVAGRSLPVPVGGTAAAGAALAAGVGAGVLDTTIGASTGSRVGTAALVAFLLGVVATGVGTRVGTELPHGGPYRLVGGETLSADALEAVDAAGQVTIRPAGDIGSFEGYPPPGPALRTALSEAVWRLPADLQLTELERRLERRLRTDHDLSRVAVSVDGRGLATITAAPPLEGIGAALPEGHRGMVVDGPFPAGLTPGDGVAIDDGTVRGEVLSVRDTDRRRSGGRAVDHHFEDDPGDGRRLVVAVGTADSGGVLADADHRVIALPSRDDPVLEATSLLAGAGHPVRAIDLDDGSAEPPGTIGVRVDGRWRFPADGVSPTGADRAFVAGPPEETSASAVGPSGGGR